MPFRDRRFGYRVPLEIFINQFVKDRLFRSLTTNLSDTGMFVQTARPTGVNEIPERQVVALEIELPQTSDTIWARGEVCYGKHDRYVHGYGIRFTGIPGAHLKLLREYCAESRRARLHTLLDRIQTGVAMA